MYLALTSDLLTHSDNKEKRKVHLQASIYQTSPQAIIIIIIVIIIIIIKYKKRNLKIHQPD